MNTNIRKRMLKMVMWVVIMGVKSGLTIGETGQD